eukprot:96162-Chlamydomonas_euryale.AAC.2
MHGARFTAWCIWGMSRTDTHHAMCQCPPCHVPTPIMASSTCSCLRFQGSGFLPCTVNHHDSCAALCME